MLAWFLLLLVIVSQVLTQNVPANESRSLLDLNAIWTKHNEPIVQIYDWLHKVSVDDNGTIQQCQESIRRLVEDERKGKSYAAQVFDSIGRPGSGILQGQFIYLGQYQQCIATKNAQFTGQYCMLSIHLPDNFYHLLSNKSGINAHKYSILKMKLGTCLPTTCSTENVQMLANKFSQHFRSPISIPAVQCIKGNNQNIEILPVSIFGGFCLLIVLLLFIGTILQYQTQNDHSEIEKTVPIFKQILLSFSMQTNLSLIFKVKKSKSDSIDVFHGMKFFAMLSIIFFHSFALGSIYTDFNNPLDLWQDAFSPILANGALSVDSFFFISGFLVAHIMLKQFMKFSKIKVNLWQFYVKRYLRMTPTMMVLVAFGAITMRYLGNGPEWMMATVSFDIFCQNNWWINLLYLQNFIKPSETCLTHTWYSAADTQFYIISPFLIMLLYKMPKFAIALFLAAIAGSIAGTWVLTVQNDYPAVSYFTSAITIEQLVGYYNSIYIKPYFRIGPYLVGILLAYAMLNTTKAVKLHKRHLITGWTLSLTTLLAITLALYPTHQGNILEIHFAATYSATARTLWACCLAWITFASKHNYGGLVSKFLSLKVWVPLSRLTYCVYLVHPFVMAIFYGSQLKPFEYSFSLMLYFTISHLVIAFLLSTILALAIEYPFVSIGQIVLKKFSCDCQ